MKDINFLDDIPSRGKPQLSKNIKLSLNEYWLEKGITALK